MKVKSDNKKQINWKKYTPTIDLSSIDYFLKTWLGALTFFTICIIVGYYVWDYSGMLSFMFWVVGIFFITYRKDYLAEKIGFSIFIILLIIWAGTVNMFSINSKSKSTIVKYDNIEYIDSKEKIVIHAQEPINKVIVIDSISAEQYYTIKGKQDLNVSIFYKPQADYYDYKKDIVSEHLYHYVIKDGDLDWKSREIEKKEKWF